MVARVQRTADGVPFLVEEVLAAPGVPASFRDTVRARLAGLGEAERPCWRPPRCSGGDFDWRLLAGVTGQPPDRWRGRWQRGVDQLLLTVDGVSSASGTRSPGTLWPERCCRPAARPWPPPRWPRWKRPTRTWPGRWRDVAADLADQAGNTGRAGVLLTASGGEALARGALATAMDTLRRAAGLLGPRPAARRCRGVAGGSAGAGRAGGRGDGRGSRPDRPAQRGSRPRVPARGSICGWRTPRWPPPGGQRPASTWPRRAPCWPRTPTRPRCPGGGPGSRGRPGRRRPGRARLLADGVLDSGAASPRCAATPWSSWGAASACATSLPPRRRSSARWPSPTGPGCRLAAAGAARTGHDRAARPRGHRAPAPGPPDSCRAGRPEHGRGRWTCSSPRPATRCSISTRRPGTPAPARHERAARPAPGPGQGAVLPRRELRDAL